MFRDARHTTVEIGGDNVELGLQGSVALDVHHRLRRALAAHGDENWRGRAPRE